MPTMQALATKSQASLLLLGQSSVFLFHFSNNCLSIACHKVYRVSEVVLGSYFLEQYIKGKGDI